MGAGERTFDYTIMGAGSAGCVPANRLSEDGDARVPLIEAGSSELPEVSVNPTLPVVSSVGRPGGKSVAAVSPSPPAGDGRTYPGLQVTRRERRR